MFGIVITVNQFVTDLKTLEQIIGISFDFVISFALVIDHTDNVSVLEKIFDPLAGNITLVEQEDDRSVFISEQTFTFFRQTDISDNSTCIFVLGKQSFELFDQILKAISRARNLSKDKETKKE